MTIRTESPRSTFIHIPKNAGTSISRWLISHCNGRWEYQRHHGGKHWTMNQMLEVESDLGMTFVCVRNPWERLVSGFFYYRKQSKFKDRTFYDFLHQKNWHSLTKPQVAYFDKTKISHVLRYENLRDDFQVIQNFFGRQNKALARDNTTDHQPYQHYYTDELRDIVAERHKADIDYFGYKFD